MNKTIEFTSIEDFMNWVDTDPEILKACKIEKKEDTEEEKDD